MEGAAAGGPSSPERVEREAARIVVCTPSGIFEGNFHHAPGVRLSDALRNAIVSDRHLLLTDVVVRADEGLARTVSQAPFVLISGAHTDVIVPVDE